MKGGVALALGVMRELAARPERYAEAAVLLVNDEEWRTVPFGHTQRFEGFDACLCFEAGELDSDRNDAVIVRRKAAGTLRVEARGRPAHSGSAPHRGRSALLALADAAQRIAAHSDPAGPARLTAVPTILHSGEAFNVVPPAGELICDLRADSLDAFQPVLDSIPAEIDEVAIAGALVRAWPGMDTRAVTAATLEEATARLGRPVVASERGGASDASHMAQTIPLTVDGLGPRGGGAHTPEEWVNRPSLRTRAEVALALVDTLLG
jgi:glutamate carboxypeptidase